MFQTRYNAARMAITDRGSRVSAVVESLEREMELLCVTGVEDKLQDKVRTTLELLRNAGIKVTHPAYQTYYCEKSTFSYCKMCLKWSMLQLLILVHNLGL